MAVRVIRVSGPDRDDHAEQHNGRREDVTRELDPGRHHRGRPRENPDDDVERREQGAGGNARERNATAGVGCEIEHAPPSLRIPWHSSCRGLLTAWCSPARRSAGFSP
jgi:hypothetical protein